MSNKDTIQKAIERFNNPSDRNGCLGIYHDNVVLHGFPPSLSPGIEGVKQFYGMVWSAFPDASVTFEDLISEGSKVVGRYTFRGTHQGEFMGIAPTGKKVEMSAITILRFDGDKCVERWNEGDLLGLMQQLGVVPSS